MCYTQFLTLHAFPLFIFNSSINNNSYDLLSVHSTRDYPDPILKFNSFNSYIINLQFMRLLPSLFTNEAPEVQRLKQLAQISGKARTQNRFLLQTSVPFSFSFLHGSFLYSLFIFWNLLRLWQHALTFFGIKKALSTSWNPIPHPRVWSLPCPYPAMPS